jgi:hypothetical protein
MIPTDPNEALALAETLIEKEGWRWNTTTDEDDPTITYYLIPPRGDDRLNWCATWHTIPGTNKVLPHWAALKEGQP